MTQQLREQTLDRLRNGRLDILIATDVAARGLDVERISLVINYDVRVVLVEQSYLLIVVNVAYYVILNRLSRNRFRKFSYRIKNF